MSQFEAVFAEPESLECRIVTITFRVEDESDALDVAEDIALLVGVSWSGQTWQAFLNHKTKSFFT